MGAGKRVFKPPNQVMCRMRLRGGIKVKLWLGEGVGSERGGEKPSTQGM